MSRTRVIGLTIAMLFITVSSILATRVAHGGGGCHEPSTDAKGTTVDLKEACIIPTVLRVDVGQTVTWVNRDAMAHTVTGVGVRSGDGRGWGSFDEIPQDGTFTHAFNHAGVYPYYCVLHPGMVGAVVAGDGNAAAYPAEMGGSLPDVLAPPPTAAAPASSSKASVVPRPMLIALGTLAALGLAGVTALRIRM